MKTTITETETGVDIATPQDATPGTTLTPAVPGMDSTAILLAELARLKAENEVLRRTPHNGPAVSFKVSEKGGVSVYGLGQFPVTLYDEQWGRLLARVEDLKGFIQKARMDGKLATAEQKLVRKLAKKEELAEAKAKKEELAEAKAK